MKVRNNYFTPDPLAHLSKCEILVFGTNIKGEHTDGAAKIAYDKFGAEWGVSNGPTGQCYAIPTIGLQLYEIEPYIKEFVEYAKSHKDNRFLLTLMGCEQGAHNYKNLAHLFRDTTFLLNVTSPNRAQTASSGSYETHVYRTSSQALPASALQRSATASGHCPCRGLQS